MKAYLIVVACLLLCGMGCKNESEEIIACNEDPKFGSMNLHSLIKSLPDYVVSELTKEPTADGALGRNKDGYFHVRFQLDIGFLAAYSIYWQSEEALQKFILAAEYSFDRQTPEGDFNLVIPANLQQLGTPSQSDISSGISFFLSAVGSSLVLLNQSDWFIKLPNTLLKQRIVVLEDKFQLALNYLKKQKEVLQKYDEEAPNRLLFDALGFYSMGIYLNDNEARTIGLEFIELALARQDLAGFYREGNGFDSSYNGVSIRLGMVLLGILKFQDALYARLKKSIACSVEWQASRVLDSGEISVQGNTRVYPGGEIFLGSEKEVAWVESLLAFYFAYSFSNETPYESLAKKLEIFYK